ncbi:DUF3137 domain-containing protein [Cellulomonas palmilytica]|uniref:DUF3137 domain-containing protein n=1 Tax=Cellulomonas palmilytica TaxID=2608402 RepID=UPI001F1FEFF3|nr:DUF3137 domain-containing protein [Cellulomonas palmilytica]UJP40093.1 hypothetical protein F1D97_00600 [Cellulomonas palmilytica]
MSSSGAVFGAGFDVAWILGIGAALMILMVVWSTISHRKHQAALDAWLTTRGWTRQPDDRSLVSRWRGSPFGTGDNRKVCDTVAGRFQQHELMSFVYSYETSSTDSDGKRSTTTHTFHVVTLQLPAFLPDLEVTPESVGSRLATAFGKTDLDVESAEFNKRYAVRATDLAVGHAILHPRLVERLLRENRVAWRIEGTTLLTWAPGRTDLQRFDARIALLAAIADAVPRHVWLDHGHDPLAR